MAVRDPLDWSLPLVWHLNASRGNTPMISRRLVDFTNEKLGKSWARSVSTSKATRTSSPAANAQEFRRPTSRARSAPRSSTAIAMRCRGLGSSASRSTRMTSVKAIAALERSEHGLRDQLVVEDPDRPLAADADGPGTARIVARPPRTCRDRSRCRDSGVSRSGRHVRPGLVGHCRWRPAPIRPAYVAFRAVYLTPGSHKIVFTYRPAGFDRGLSLSGCGILLGSCLWFWPRSSLALAPEHAVLNWPLRWRTWWFLALGAIVLVSAVAIGPSGRPGLHTAGKTASIAIPGVPGSQR